MSNSFSIRQGIVLASDIDPTDMPTSLKNRIWNALHDYLEKINNRDGIIEYIWDGFFGNNNDLLNTSSIAFFHNIKKVHLQYSLLEWNKVYDFIEFILTVKVGNESILINKLNLILEQERAQYRIIDKKVVPLISEEEIQEINKAQSTKYHEVNSHIKKAVDLYSKRPNADIQNSIKESISALEALARIVLNRPTATLGELANELEIHSALKGGIKKLYGWTSDQGGVRHSENNESLEITDSEARFMLVQCSALVNYIISKYEENK